MRNPPVKENVLIRSKRKNLKKLQKKGNHNEIMMKTMLSDMVHFASNLKILMVP
jgi:hypothetical protein